MSHLADSVNKSSAFCMLQQEILEAATSQEDFTIAIRRHFHQYPELSWQEEKTLQTIRNEVAQMNQQTPFPFVLTETEGGIWYDLTIDQTAPRLLFRADIDALPITEKNQEPFASCVPGVMHACGHDCHAAMLLGAMRAIATGEVQPKCNIRFVFQRAEEVGGRCSGGALMVKGGVCNDVDQAYALHISGRNAPGIFFSRPGTLLCDPTTLEIEIETHGGHIATPYLGTNAIDVLNTLISEFRGAERQMLPPDETLIFLPTMIQAGTASNIRPNSARITFALRHFLTDKKLHAFVNKLKEKAHKIADSYCNTTMTKFELHPSYPVLINDSQSTRFVSSALNRLGFSTEPEEVTFAGEDFSYFLQQCRGSYWILGAHQEGCLDHHTAYFNPDESVLYRGIAFWLLLATQTPP